MELSVPGLFENFNLCLLVHDIGIQHDNCSKCLPDRRTEILKFLAFDVSPILSKNIDLWSSAIFRYNRGGEEYFRIQVSEGSFKKQLFTNAFNVTDIHVHGIASLFTSEKPRSFLMKKNISH